MGFLTSLAGGANVGQAAGLSGAGAGVTAALGGGMPPWLKMAMNQVSQMGGQQGGGGGLQMPDAPQGDPMAMLRSLGIDLSSNHLGRLGQS